MVNTFLGSFKYVSNYYALNIHSEVSHTHVRQAPCWPYTVLEYTGAITRLGLCTCVLSAYLVAAHHELVMKHFKISGIWFAVENI